MIQAFMWPVFMIQMWQPFGLILLVLLFILFPAVLKKPIERWLFGDQPLESDTKAE